ncbi:hypothetical protein EC991_000658, partial [Linnemannia zychae]
MDSLSTDGNEDHDIVHQVGGQSSRPSIPSSLAPDGMDAGPKSLSTDRQDVGSSHSGPIRIEDQHPAPTVFLMETGSTSTSNQRTHSAVDTRERLRQSAMGPHLTVPSEDSERAIDTHSDYPLLAISDMVPNSEEPCTAPSSPDPATGSSRLFSRRDSVGLDTGSLAHQRQRLTEEGASVATVK